MLRASLPLFVLFLPALASAEPARLTVDDVVHIALASSPELVSARARATAAEHLRQSAGGRMLPSVVVSDEYQHWDSAFTIAFPGAPMGAGLTAREQDTNTFAVAASQPLLGLLRRSEAYKAQARSAEAASAGVRVSEAAAREAIEVEYLRMFEAQALRDIAQASEAELGRQVSITEAEVKAGARTNSDLLRVRVAQSNARQQGIEASTQMTVARANLLGVIGYPPSDASVAFAEPTSLLSGTEPDEKSAARAVDRRPEVKRAELQAEAAHHEERSHLYGLLPEVDLEAAYSRVDGQVFAPKDSAFVGVKAAWPIWEWGASYNARRAAAAQARAAESDVEAERRRVRVEVASRRAELDAAKSAVELAEETIKSAEEAYRVTDALVRAGSGTVSDLLDAQSALTQARHHLTRARYEHAIARIQLERSAGVP
jgi:outer membrane protein TolC